MIIMSLYSSGVLKPKGTTFPFKYNDINAITSLVEDEVGIVKMEVQEMNHQLIISLSK